tara:strand:+ start:1302 stop:1625 length:324 start_codon:yes stop_codon:yes gene_type:complete
MARRKLVLDRLVFQFGRDSNYFLQIHAVEDWHRLEEESQVNKLRKLRDIRSGLRNEKEVRENVKEMSDIEQAIYFDHNALGTDCGCVSTINIKDPNNYIIINGVKEE